MRTRGIIISSLIIMGILTGCQATPKSKGKTSNTSNNSVIKAHKPATGYYVDQYLKNTNHNVTSKNPAVELLQPMNRLWNSKKAVAVNHQVQHLNLQTSIKMTQHHTAAEAKQAYFDDRRNYPYSVLPGLTNYEAVFIKNAKAKTTITKVPDNAAKHLATDHGNRQHQWASPKSELGTIVKLVNTATNNHSNATAAKQFYQYPRPFRQSTAVNQLASLKPAFKADAKSDFGFPSGHTTKAYESSLALAYAVPERYQALLTKAATVGDSRIIAGWHSPLDVMGGRLLGTAVTTGILNDRKNANLRQQAYQTAHSSALLTSKAVATKKAPLDYHANQLAYTKRLTYGFQQIGNRKLAPRVPKGSEVLLATRLPYLTAEQRRTVLASTELPSGYPLLDDTEGYGRLNLFSATGGYAKFATDTTVNMDANRGGFNATDTWRNSISGTGNLTKTGSGALALNGNNTYRGNTAIKGGTLIAASPNAFGQGNVTVTNGIMAVDTKQGVTLRHDLVENAGGQLIISLHQNVQPLHVKGNVNLAGTLKLNLQKKLKTGTSLKLITFNSNHKNTHFSRVLIRDHQQGLQLRYTKQAVILTVN